MLFNCKFYIGVDILSDFFHGVDQYFECNLIPSECKDSSVWVVFMPKKCTQTIEILCK